MKLDVYTTKTSNVFAENRMSKMVLIVLVIIECVNIFLTQRALDYQRTIVVPPVITSKLEFNGDKVSESYLKEFVRYTCSLAFNYSPALARLQFDELLSLYDPTSFPVAKQMFYQLSDKIETARVNSFFLLSRIVLDKAKNVIEVQGNKRMFLDDGTTIEAGGTVYYISYKIVNGRFLLTKIEETQSVADEVKK